MHEGVSLLRSRITNKLIPFGALQNLPEGESEPSDDDLDFECEDEDFLSSIGAEIVTVSSSDDEDSLQFFR